MKKLLVLFLVGLFCISFISAFTFDNIKSFDSKVGDYGKIEIRNSVLGLKWFQLDKIAELELKENTDTCDSSCSAETEIVMYQRGSLIDDVKFMTLQEDECWIKQDIRSYQFYIKTDEETYDVDDFEYQCKEREVYSAINDTTYTESYDCKNVKVGTHKETEKLWEEYTLGTEVETGTYEIKLEGEKKPSRTVDWQITSQGKLIDEWALWGALSYGEAVYPNSYDTITGFISNYAGFGFVPDVKIMIDNLTIDATGTSGNPYATKGYILNGSLDILFTADIISKVTTFTDNTLSVGETYLLQ